MPKTSLNKKPCQNCGSHFKPDRSVRRFCSVSCSNEFRIRRSDGRYKKREVKCSECGTQFITRQDQKTCSKECASIRRLRIRLELWLSNKDYIYNRFGELLPWQRSYLISMHGDESCWECGWLGYNKKTSKCVVQVDHIDGDPTNNRINNLRRLCPNCHAMTETYGCHGRGRPGRYAV